MTAQELDIGDLDLSSTVFSEVDEPPTLIDSNGTKYLVGTDNYGWKSILTVELYHQDDGSVAVERQTELSIVSFEPDNVDDVVDALTSET
jgi:hypothetical protein